MKECPKCGELNSEKNTTCFNCKAYLTQVKSTTRICPKCMQVYCDSESDECPKCHTALRDYDMSYASMKNGTAKKGTDTPMWVYVVSILLPMVGLIMGFVYLSRKEDDIAKKLILISIIVGIVWGVAYYFMVSNMIGSL